MAINLLFFLKIEDSKNVLENESKEVTYIDAKKRLHIYRSIIGLVPPVSILSYAK